MIPFADMMKAINRGDVFSATVVTYNRQRKSGGQLLELTEAQIERTIASTLDDERHDRTHRGTTALEELRSRKEQLKNPNHHQNHTINIRIIQDGFRTSEIRKIHPLLITSFNGQPIIL